MNDNAELELKVRERLEEIKPVPARDPQVVYRARMQFLSKAVSASEEDRHKGWSSIFRKERFTMSMMISILVIAGLFFGGGATVNAAQDDLPNEPLYSLKIWSEDLSLQFRNDPEHKVERLMELTRIRIDEMMRLSENGQSVPDQTRLRLEQHIQDALQICSTLEDAALDRNLLQIRDHLQQQEWDMERIQFQTTQDTQITATRTMLQQRLQLVDDGLLDHEMFRNAVRNGFRYGHEEEINPPVQDGNGLQSGQPTSIPSGPHTVPEGTSTGPGEPNTDPGRPNMDSGGSNGSSTPSSTNDGSDSGGMGPGGGGSGDNKSGGGGSGGGDSGGKGPGGGGGGNRP